MTALDTLANRATILDQLAANAAGLREAAAMLDLAEYPDLSTLGAARASLKSAARLTDGVMGSIALLGTEAE